MVRPERVRRLALGLLGTSEQDHHGRPSFRVGGHIFATLWDDTHLNVMLEPQRIEALSSEPTGMCVPIRWGRRLAALQVHLERATPGEVALLLEEAWRRRTRVTPTAPPRRRSPTPAE
ncbi:MAG: MmcQ/YjbR family DNA-binding protein [Candidatus Dormibacteria bacterium]